MDDSKSNKRVIAPDVSEEDENSTELLENTKELCKKYDVKDSDECREHGVPRDLTDKLFKEPAKAKLRFGIEAILNAGSRTESTNKHLHTENITYNEQFHKTDKHENDDEKMNKLERRLSTSYMESLLSKDNGDDDDDDDNDDDDDEIDSESKDYKSLKFDIDVARARLAYMGYTASFSSPGLTDQGGMPLQPNSILPPFPVSNATYPWAAVSDIRKERFSMVRRIGHPYQNRTPPKRKKPRTSFTRLQILELEKRFERQKYLASTERSALAKTLKMTDAQVKTWFQNRRTKWRRQTAEEREIERQAANRLLLSLQSDPAHRKSMVMTPDSVCLSHLQRWQEKRSVDI